MRAGYATYAHQLSKRIKVGVEYTHMGYLAQQPGGLQDYEFYQNPRTSKRSRNFFRVDWNLAAAHLDYRISDATQINSRTFYLHARRDALGELGPINRPDPGLQRDLVRGLYRNAGSETRLKHRYQIGGQYTTLIAGVRYYQGFSRSRQGIGSGGSDADFAFYQNDTPLDADYDFPSRNVSAFAENLFNLTDRWTLTPGVRWEYIRTAADGTYLQQVVAGDQVIYQETFEESRYNARSLALMGVGSSYRLKDDVELYANWSQNYRAINFTDLAIINPNLVVDDQLNDESGYNADLGVRGTAYKEAVRFDATAFWLQYNDRIGITTLRIPDPLVVERDVPYRTNVGDARILGVELYAEADIATLALGDKQPLRAVAFVNGSAIHGRYTNTYNTAYQGNEVEFVPPLSFKTGLTIGYRDLRVAYQYSYTAEQYTDGTNAVFVADATRGIVPAYHVMDLSASYRYRRYSIQTGLNNLTDRKYFTRRAVSYPGPGIIPADGRSFYITVGVSL